MPRQVGELDRFDDRVLNKRIDQPDSQTSLTIQARRRLWPKPCLHLCAFEGRTEATMRDPAHRFLAP